ncbi:TonB-dependent receptor domain-containing protein [Hyphomonas sp.]|uniref:TonB-dependent receptor domain-containing protein n=1 Tax=Hyphomonas sp. TaxID=87 RepID=UPI00391BFAB0
MNEATWKKRLLSSTLFAGAMLAVGGPMAAAQEVDETPVETVSSTDVEGEARQQRITVTGSRLVRRDEVAESPIVTVGQDAFTTSGLTTVEQYLNTLPQITPSLSSQSNNPSSNGRAVLDLRGLGSGRNLVLVDGRRGMPSFAGGTVDINTIPAALIERVEVITGGAASTYGADAVAGVANFILRKDFEGVEFDGQYRAALEEGDAVEWGAGVTMGSSFAEGRGNAILSMNYFTREVVGKGARAFSAQASSATGIFPGGSFVPGTNAPSDAAVAAIFGANQCNAGGTYGFNPDGSLFCVGVGGNPNRNVVGYTGPQSDIATRFFPDFFSYNFEPDNNLVLPLNRWNVYTSADYQVNDYVRAYGQFIFTNYNATQELAPTPAAVGTVPVTNPFIGPQLAALLASRPNPDAPFTFNKRFNDLGGRTGATDHNVWQMTLGFDGSLLGTETWTYDVYWSYGRSSLNEIQGGNVRLDRTRELLNAADGGASLCAGGLNLFGAAPISQACRDRISLRAKNLTEIEQQIIEAVIQGEVIELPAGPIQAAFGVQYRELDFNFLPDSGLTPGVVAGFNEQLPTSGYLDWYDAYTEALVPVLKDLPFIEELNLTLGYRVTDNSRSGSSDTYKINGDWKVNDNFRFRGGYQKAIRAPSITELFAPVLNNFPNFTNQDPCNTTGANLTASFGRGGPNGAQVAALCAVQSAVAGGPNYVQPAGQARGLVGGNDQLQPETSNSYTFGFVASSPFTGNSFVESLGLTVDYWAIELEDVIASVGAATIVQRCFNRDGANPNFDPSNIWCTLFQRDQSDGGVINLQQFSRNQAFLETSGVDVTARWGVDLGTMGALNWNLIATWVEKSTSQTTNVDPVNDFVGTIGSGTGSATPEWKFTLNTGYSNDRVNMNLRTRYIDNMKHAGTVTGGSPLTNTPVPATWYLDLNGTYALTDFVTLRAGINNLLDQQPRLYSPNIQANTDPSTYDVVGRAAFVGVNLRF